MSTTHLTIGDSYSVNRLGFGAMQITGTGVWGDPSDPDSAKQLLRHVVELGVDFIDTADSYGPEVSERLIGEALAPYAENIVIATKAGLVRPGPGDWKPNGHPDHIKAACEGSLQRLRLERIPLYQLHRIDPDVPVADSIGAMLELQAAGKIDKIGLSEVSVAELRQVQALTPVASVQNRYNIAYREWQDVLEACEQDGVAFIPWYPVASGDLGTSTAALDAVASAHDTSRYAVAIAWLLRQSPAMLPIPGTSSIPHLEENMSAAELLDRITDAEWAQLDAAV
jgi:aryl-alcohol dehydrogenase-like predicted oxidoreductase